MKTSLLYPIALAAFISLFISNSSMQATVATLQELQVANANAVYQYSFEGANDSVYLPRRTDKIGGVVLANLATGFSVSYANSTLLADGSPATPPRTAFDSSSFAAFTRDGASTNGASLSNSTAGAFTLSLTGTIEYLIKPTIINDGGYAIGATVTAAGSGTNNPRFIFHYNGGAATNIAYSTLGTASGVALIGGSTGVSYSADNWYYVAQTWSISSVSNGTVTMNAWVANLTAGDTSLTQTINGVSHAFNAANLNSASFGLGTYAGGTTTRFDGGFDALTIYNTALDSSVLQAHLGVVPEPSTVALFVLGFGVVGWVRRKRRAR